MKKKILIAFNGMAYSPSLTRFAIDLAHESNSLLIGAFINDLSYIDNIFVQGYSANVVGVYDAAKIEAEDEKETHKYIKLFEAECKKGGVQYKVHLDTGVPLRELLTESEFADLILIDVKTNFSAFSDKTPSTFLKDLLVESNCPVLIVPEHPEQIKHILFSYDGSDSSIYAMKMLSYLFPEWQDNDATIVSLNKDSSSQTPRNGIAKHLAKQHFNKVAFEDLVGDSEDVLIRYLAKNKKESLVVMGAYARSAWSRMFHASVSNKVMNDVKMPIFITHQ